MRHKDFIKKYNQFDIFTIFKLKEEFVGVNGVSDIIIFSPNDSLEMDSGKKFIFIDKRYRWWMGCIYIKIFNQERYKIINKEKLYSIFSKRDIKSVKNFIRNPKNNSLLAYV